MAVRTRRWTRSPRGTILGVATGLAEWRGFPVDITRLIVFIALCCTAFVPGALVYLGLAILLPAQTKADIVSDDEWEESYNDQFRSHRSRRRTTSAEDATFREAKKTESDLEKEYEALKKKVEEMENEVFDKEKDWDARFNKETK